MPEFTAKFDPDDGPLIRIRLAGPMADRRRRQRTGRTVPQPVVVTALIDTGAENTCVAGRILARLDVSFTKARLVNAPGVSNKLSAAVFRECEIGIVFDDGTERTLVETAEILEFDTGALGYDALLGRDVLSRCVFTYDGPMNTYGLRF